MEDLTIIDRTKISKEEEYKGVHGDYHQAEGLMEKKRQFKK